MVKLLGIIGVNFAK